MFGRPIKKSSPRKRKSLTLRTGSTNKRLSNVGMLATPSSKVAVNCSSNIRVLLRVRPSSRRELDDNRWRDVVEVVDKDLVIFDPKEEDDFFFHQGKKLAYRDINKKTPKNLQFNFDQVFSPEESTGDVYTKSIQTLISSLMGGYNCSVFAYGATGAGKTHTMLGTPNEPGVTPLLMKELYDTLLQESSDVDVAVSYLEIYNENVHDLLVQHSPPKALQLREDGATVMVSDLSWHRPATASQLMAILQEGNQRRTQHPTDANKESSRSHAVFQVLVKMKKKTEGVGRMGQVRCAKLSMIDLAGSERAAATTNNKSRFAEGANINKSLLALGNCINALADNLKHVPFRNSKLTRLLKGSLGGNCQTVMIANVSPSSIVYEDTYNTLKYATRAKKIKNRVKKNLISVDVSAAETAKELEGVKVEMQRVMAQNAALVAENEALKLAASQHVCEVREKVITVMKEALPVVDAVQEEAEMPTSEPSPKPDSPVFAEEPKGLEVLETLRALRETCKQFDAAAAAKCNLEAELERLEYNHDVKKLKFQRINELSKEGTQIKESSHEIKTTAQRLNLENRLHMATQQEEACFAKLQEHISKLEKFDATLVNLANIMLLPYCNGKKKELKYTSCARLSGQKTVEIETLQSVFLRCASTLHRCFFTLKGLCCVSPELQSQFDDVLSMVRQSGSVTFKSEDEHSDSPDGPMRKTDDFDNFMDEFEQELLAKPLDQTFNAESAASAAPVENMDATFCVAPPTEAKKQRISPPMRQMEAPFRVKPYSGGFKRKQGTPMRSSFKNKLKGAGAISSAARVAKPLLSATKKLATNKENDPS